MLKIQEARKPRPRHYSRAALAYWVAIVRVLAALVLIAFCVLLYQVFQTRDPGTGYTALTLLGVFVVLRVYAFSKAQQLRCPLCHGTLLISNACHKHHSATRLPLLGHTWSVILHILFRLRFRCMYCGTKYRLRK